MHALVTRLRSVTDRCYDAMTGRRWSLIVGVLLLLTTSRRLDARHVTVCDDQPSQLSDFTDVASLTILSFAVFDGRPVHVDDTDQDVVEFRVGQFYKGGAEMSPEGPEQSSSVHIAVRLSSVQCARSLRRRRRRFLVFLNESQAADSLGDDRSVFSSTAPPVRFSRRSVKVVKKHSCPNCCMCFVAYAEFTNNNSLVIIITCFRTSLSMLHSRS